MPSQKAPPETELTITSGGLWRQRCNCFSGFGDV
jgi:hypothetical protein